MCMITIGNKVYRNLEEQVKKNKDDIEKLQASSVTITGESIANVTNDTSTIVKHLADNSNIEYTLSTPISDKINNSLQLPNTEISYTQLVGIGTNKSQANIEIDTATLKIENNKLSAITSGVTKEYVDSQDAKLQQSINATDSQVQTLNEEVATIKTDTIPALNNQLAATNTEVAKKLNKMTSTGSGVKAYVHQDGVDKLLNATSDKTRNLIVRWDSNAQLHANAGTTDDAVVNKKQLDDAIANKLDKATTTSGSYAYCRNGNRDETIPVNSLVGTDAIVRRTSTGTIKANAGVDENDCVNKKQLDDAIAGVGGGGAQLNVANTWTAVQTFNEGITTAGAINIAGQGSINITGDISCDGSLTLAGGDILQGGTGNFSSLVTSSSYIIDTSAASTYDSTIEAFKFKYKYISTVYTQTYYFVRKNSNVGATILTNKDVDTKDFEWNNSTNKLELTMHIVSCDQAFYDRLTTKDKSTLYVIVE